MSNHTNLCCDVHLTRMFRRPPQGQQPPSTFIPADQFSPAHLIHHPDTDPDGSEAPNHRGFLAVESHSPERQRIGGLLYQQVSKLNPDIPGKITGGRKAEGYLVGMLCYT